MTRRQLLGIVIGVFLQLRGSTADDFECGTADIIIPRISGGHSTIRGEWPFLAALYHVERMKFFCGGTLISRRHVLTAAHCVHLKDSGEELETDDIVVLLGAYNLLSTVEKGTVHREVNAIHVHKQWKVYGLKYDSDIAILELSESVTFTYFIRPVCMPTDFITIEDTRGSIVGWGLDDNGMMHLELPKHAITIARNHSYCLTTDPILATLSSTRTFCANGGDGVPQQGDSGGGFFALSGSSWVQYGIISALRVNATGIFDLNSFAVYTNVKLFKSWIEDIVGQTKDEVRSLDDSSKNGIELFCRYDNDEELGYTCRVLGFDIQSEDVRVTSFTGIHISGKTDSDVASIFFWDGTLHYLPNGIGNVFKNLKSIVVSYSLSLKAIKPSNVKNLENLVTLVVQANDIVNFDAGILSRLKKLEKLSIERNLLTAVDRKLLEKNYKLMELKLTDNRIETIDEKALLFLTNLKKFSISKNRLKEIHYRTFEENAQLTEIDLSHNVIEDLRSFLLSNLKNLEKIFINQNKLTYLESRFFENNINLKEVNLAGNQLTALGAGFFKYNSLLESAHFGANALKTVNTDFSVLSHARYLDFGGNVCVSVIFYGETDNLADFQSVLRKNCTSGVSF